MKMRVQWGGGGGGGRLFFWGGGCLGERRIDVIVKILKKGVRSGWM